MTKLSLETCAQRSESSPPVDCRAAILYVAGQRRVFAGRIIRLRLTAPVMHGPGHVAGGFRTHFPSVPPWFLIADSVAKVQPTLQIGDNVSQTLPPRAVL